LGAAPAASDVNEQLSSPRLLLAYISEHRIKVDDGTQRSQIVGGALIAAFVLATVLLLVSHLSFGPEDVYLPGGLDGGSVSAVLTFGVLVLSAAFLAAIAWHAADPDRATTGVRVGGLDLIPAGLAVLNAVVGVSLISTAATIRTTGSLFAELPSLVPFDASTGDVALVLGIVVLLSCLIFLTVSVFAPHQRVLIMILAALPATLCAVAFASANRDGLVLSNWANRTLSAQSSAATVGYIAAPASARIANAPLLILVLGSTAFLLLLVTFGVVEFVDAKAKVTQLLVGARRIQTWVVAAMLGLVAVVFVAGRNGWLPDGKEAAGAFNETAPEAWIVAALMGLAGLLTIRSAHRRPLERRRVRSVVVIACVSLAAGQFVLFVASLIMQLSSPIVNPASAIGRFVFDRVPGWSLWFASWTTLLISIAMGLWAAWRIARRERSDRVVFALAFAVVVFPLRLSGLLAEHDAAHGVWDYHNATPDLIALTAIGLIAVTLIARRPLFDNRTAAVVVAVAFLVTLLDAAVPIEFTFGTFQLLLVAPFLYRFLLNSDELRSSTHRAAITMAGIGLLFLANSAAVAVGGLTSERFEVGELFSFTQLAAPLALLVLCPTTLPSESAVASQLAGPTKPLQVRGRRFVIVGAAIAAAALIVGVTAFAVVRLPGMTERGPFQVDVRVVPADLTPSQVRFDVGGEVVQLTNGADTVIFVVHIKSSQPADVQPCAEGNLGEGLGVTLTGSLRAVDPVAGLPAVSGTVVLSDGSELTMTCANQTDGDVARTFVVFEPTRELSTTARAVAEGIVFRKE